MLVVFNVSLRMGLCFLLSGVKLSQSFHVSISEAANHSSSIMAASGRCIFVHARRCTSMVEVHRLQVLPNLKSTHPRYLCGIYSSCKRIL